MHDDITRENKFPSGSMSLSAPSGMAMSAVHLNSNNSEVNPPLKEELQCVSPPSPGIPSSAASFCVFPEIYCDVDVSGQMKEELDENDEAQTGDENAEEEQMSEDDKTQVLEAVASVSGRSNNRNCGYSDVRVLLHDVMATDTGQAWLQDGSQNQLKKTSGQNSAHKSMKSAKMKSSSKKKMDELRMKTAELNTQAKQSERQHSLRKRPKLSFVETLDSASSCDEQQRGCWYPNLAKTLVSRKAKTTKKTVLRRKPLMPARLFSVQREIDTESETESSSANTKNASANRSNKRTCQNCGVAFISVGFLRKHAVSCKPKLKAKSPEKRPAARIRNKNRHHCSICLKTFTRSDSLKVHTRQHTNWRPYQCTLCPSAFHVRAHLNGHIAAIHEDHTGQYVCKICQKELSCPTSLRRHMKTCGVGVEHRIRFRCAGCGKGFVTALGHDKHRTNSDCASDMDVKPNPNELRQATHRCTLCPKTFFLVSSLQKHALVHKKRLRYECPQCPASFHATTHLRDHLTAKHKVCVCVNCNKQLSCQTSLKRHMKRCGVPVENRLMFRCIDCGQGFVTTEGYEKHRANPVCTSVSTIRHKPQRVFYDPDSQDSSQDSDTETEWQASDSPDAKTDTDTEVENAAEDNATESQQIASLYEGGVWCPAESRSQPLSAHLENGIKVEQTELRCFQCREEFDDFTTLDCHQRFLCGLPVESFQCYQCPECDRNFARRSVYITHAHFHCGVRPYKCRRCSTRFITKNALQRHEDRHTDAKLKCTLCDVVYKTRESLMMHMMRVHCGLKPYKCNECDRDFRGCQQLSNHIRRIHRKERPYRCMLCERSFFESHHWRTHMLDHAKVATEVIAQHKTSGAGEGDSGQTHNAGETREQGEGENDDDGGDVVGQRNEHQDNQTSMATRSSNLTSSQSPSQTEESSAQQPSSLFEKQSRGSVVIDGITSAAGVKSITFNLPEPVVKEILERDVPFKRKQYKPKFKKKKKKKKKKEGPQKPINEYACGICGHAFSMKRLEYHIIEKHSDVPDAMKAGLKQVCSICQKKASTPMSLYNHINNLHRYVGEFPCSQCNKVFTLKKQRQKHMIVHSDDRPFQCDQCAVSYKWKSLLTAHMKDVHDPEIQVGEDGKRFTCNVCGKRLAGTIHLRTHMLLHQDTLPAICSVCGKGFISNTRLRVHMGSHNDGSHEEASRPHLCHHCGKGYFYAHLLQRHILSRHSENKRFLCTICGRGLTSKYSLQVHTKIHTRNINRDRRPGRVPRRKKAERVPRTNNERASKTKNDVGGSRSEIRKRDFDAANDNNVSSSSSTALDAGRVTNNKDYNLTNNKDYNLTNNKDVSVEERSRNSKATNSNPTLLDGYGDVSTSHERDVSLYRSSSDTGTVENKRVVRIYDRDDGLNEIDRESVQNTHSVQNTNSARSPEQHASLIQSDVDSHSIQNDRVSHAVQNRNSMNMTLDRDLNMTKRNDNTFENDRDKDIREGNNSYSNSLPYATAGMQQACSEMRGRGEFLPRPRTPPYPAVISQAISPVLGPSWSSFNLTPSAPGAWKYLAKD